MCRCGRCAPHYSMYLTGSRNNLNKSTAIFGRQLIFQSTFIATHCRSLLEIVGFLADAMHRQNQDMPSSQCSAITKAALFVAPSSDRRLCVGEQVDELGFAHGRLVSATP